jgi:hypothetical protein
MQRSLSNQISIDLIILIPLFLLYESLSSIYLFMPPLFGVIFYFYTEEKNLNDIKILLFYALILIIYEAEKSYLFLSTFFYFTLVYIFIIPYLKQNIVCKSCLKLLYIVIAYIGYYFFMLLLAHMFLLQLPSIDMHVLYYILVEFLIVSLL